MNNHRTRAERTQERQSITATCVSGVERKVVALRLGFVASFDVVDVSRQTALDRSQQRALERRIDDRNVELVLVIARILTFLQRNRINTSHAETAGFA